MKYLFQFSLLFLLISSIKAQNISTKFYDVNWKECSLPNARFYSTIEKTDSGWFRNDYYISTKTLQMSALFKDSLFRIHNGMAIYFYANGQLKSIGNYVDGRKEGLYLGYHYNGMMEDSAYYKNGKLEGVAISWFPNGFMSDSSFAKNDSTLVSVRWFDNGNPSDYGYFINKKKQGKWMYFHKNGQTAAVEINERGKVLEVTYFNEDGSVQPDTSKANQEASFRNGIKDWSNYLSGKIYWPSQYKLTHTDTAKVMTVFTVDEDGKVVDYFVEVPFHPLLDAVALDALKKCPAWKPAIDHNRRIKAYRRQPLTFTQSEEE